MFRNFSLILLALVLSSASLENAVAAAAQQVPAQSGSGDAEAAFWQAIANKYKADFQAYLNAFPNGRFAPIAREMLRDADPGVASSVTLPTPPPSNTRPPTNNVPSRAATAPVTAPAAGPQAAPPPAAAATPSNAAPVVVGLAAWSGNWESRRVAGQTSVGDGRWTAIIKENVIEITQTAEFATCQSRQQWCRPGGPLAGPRIIRAVIDGATFAGTYEADNAVGIASGQRVKTSVDGTMSADQKHIRVDYGGLIGRRLLVDLVRP